MTAKDEKKRWQTAIRQAARQAGWGMNGGFLFRKTGDMFYDCLVMHHAKTAKISAMLSVKPYALDNLFWTVVGLSENRNRPLSFRASAAFCVPSAHLADLSMPTGPADNADQKAAELIATLDNHRTVHHNQYSALTDYTAWLEADDRRMAQNRVGLVTAWLLTGNTARVHALLDTWQQQGIPSGFRFGWPPERGIGSDDYVDLLR